MSKKALKKATQEQKGSQTLNKNTEPSAQHITALFYRIGKHPIKTVLHLLNVSPGKNPSANHPFKAELLLLIIATSVIYP
jgi:hypothetical protein